MRYEIRPLEFWTDPETKPRQPSPFSAPWSTTLDLLGRETSQLGARLVVIQLDVTEGDIRRDGMVLAGAKVGHPGVVVSFESRFGPLRYAADTYSGTSRYPAWQSNVRAVALSLEALRAVDRWGASKRGEQYRGWKALPATTGVTFPSADEALRWMREMDGGAPADARTTYRRLARKMHPDAGGTTDDWDRLDAAKLLLTESGLM